MDNLRWILISIFLFTLSGFISWIMPDGLNSISQLFGQDTYPVTSLIRLLCFMFTFLFMVGIEMIIWIRIEIQNLKKEVPHLLVNQFTARTKEVYENSLAQIMLKSLKDNPQNISYIYKIIEKFTENISILPSHILDAYLIFIESFIRRFNENIKNLGQNGCHVELSEHIETTKWLATKSRTYLQIQRKAFLVPDEWTNQWCQFVNWLQKRKISCEYIVLMDRQSLINERKKLESMNVYLSKRGFIFKCCVLEDVQDSLGGSLPTEENIELFDNKIVKLQAIPSGGYKGGITIKMTLFDISQRDKIRRLINCTKHFSGNV